MPKRKVSNSANAKKLKERIKYLEWQIQRLWASSNALVEQFQVLSEKKRYVMPKTPVPKCPLKKLDLMARNAFLSAVDFDAINKTLEHISNTFPVRSKNRAAIILSARALGFVQYNIIPYDGRKINSRLRSKSRKT